MSFQKSIKHHLSKGEPEKAIELLLLYSETKNQEFQKSCLLLSSQFQQWKKNNIIGIKKESADLRRIEFSILELLEIEDDSSEKIGTPDIYRRKNKWILAISLVLISTLVIFILVTYLNNNQPDYIFTEPRDEETLTRQLIDSCCYWINIKGKVVGDKNQKIFGKYFHGGEWFFEEIENPIQLEADGSWEVSFPHGDKKTSAKRMEEFKFGIFLIENDKSINNYKKIEEMTFSVMVVD